MHSIKRLLFLPGLAFLLGLSACQKSDSSKLQATQVEGNKPDVNLPLGSGYARDFAIFLNQKETCVTGEPIFVPNPEIWINNRQDMTLDESLKSLSVGTEVSVNWDFLIAKATAKGTVETSLNLLSKDRRVVLFTEIKYRAGSLFLKNLQWSPKFALDTTAKEALAFNCGEEALTRVDLGSSMIVAFDFVANSDLLSQQLKAYISGEVKVAGVKKSKKVKLFDGYLGSIEDFEGSAKIYARQVGGSMGAFEVASGMENGESKECRMRLSATSSEEEVQQELGRCLSIYNSMINYLKDNYRLQLKNPNGLYLLKPAEAISTYAPIKYYFEDYKDLGFDYPDTSRVLPREVKSTIKLILKRYMALRGLINQLQRFKSSGIDFGSDLNLNGVLNLSELIKYVEDLQNSIFKQDGSGRSGDVVQACKADTLGDCQALLKSIDKRLNVLRQKYPLIRNNIQL